VAVRAILVPSNQTKTMTEGENEKEKQKERQEADSEQERSFGESKIKREEWEEKISGEA